MILLKLLQKRMDKSQNDSFEDSYERDSRWLPHLSWSFFNSTLRQTMKEQASQREDSWRRIQFLVNNF